MGFIQISGISIGLILGMVYWLYLRPIARQSTTTQIALSNTSKSRELLSFLCNLLIIEIGTVISLVTLGGNSMNNPTIQAIIFIIWITVGFALGTVIYIIWKGVKSIVNQRSPKRKREIRIIAYHIWEQEGCPNDRDKERWEKAEAIWKELKKAI